MRLASALLASLLLAASTATAAPTASGQNTAAPPEEANSPGPGVQNAIAAQTPDKPAPQLTRARYPSFGNGASKSDRATEADCYYVFGQLRCDRVPTGSHSRTPG